MFYVKNKDDAELKKTDYSLHLEPLSNVSSFVTISKHLVDFYGDILTDNSRFIGNSPFVNFNEIIDKHKISDLIDAADDVDADHETDNVEDLMNIKNLENPGDIEINDVKPGGIVIFDSDEYAIDTLKNTIHDKYYGKSKDIIKTHRNNSIKIGDFVVVNNTIVDYPIVFEIMPQPEISDIDAIT